MTLGIDIIDDTIGGGWWDSASSALDTISPFVSAGASFLGGSAANAANKEMARDNRRFQKSQAKIARRYNKNMSNTAHRRAMRDLKKAGLNPILAAQHPASSPTSPSPAGSMAQIQDVVTPAINTGLNQMQTEASVEKTDQERKNLVQEINNMEAQEFLTLVQRRVAQQDVNKRMKEVELIGEEIKIAEKSGLIATAKYEAIKSLLASSAEGVGDNPLGQLLLLILED